MEQIVFAAPAICEKLTDETKECILKTTKMDEQGSKIEDFFKRTDGLYEEMKVQQLLEGTYCGYKEHIAFTCICVYSYRWNLLYFQVIE